MKKLYSILIKVLAMDPNNVGGLGGKGISLDELGKHEEAIQLYDRVPAIDPNLS